MLVRLATCGRYMLCSSDDKVDNFLLRNLETLKELQHLLQRQRQCDIIMCVCAEEMGLQPHRPDDSDSKTMQVCS